jgi:hypothetical protein
MGDSRLGGSFLWYAKLICGGIVLCALLIGAINAFFAVSPPAPPAPPDPAAPAPLAAEPAEPATPEPVEQPQVVQIKTLLSEYKDNEVRADQQFKGRLISTTGKVSGIKKDVEDHIYVTIGTGAMFELPTLQCFPRGQENEAAALSKGDTVSIQGRVKGLMMNVLVKECQIVSSTR